MMGHHLQVIALVLPTALLLVMALGAADGGVNVNCSNPDKTEILTETARVGQDVVLSCGKSPESRQALANKTLTIWRHAPLGMNPSERVGNNLIPIIKPKKTKDGHTSKIPERTGQYVVNYANSSLRVLNVTLKNRMNFHCAVYNGPRCFYIVLVQLIVVDRPGPPVNVTMEGLSDSELRVRWSPGPDNFSPITGYKLKVDSHESSTRREFDCSANDTEYVVPHLKAYKQYYASVQARNKEGGSDWTMPVYQNTTEGVPTVVPVLYKKDSTSESVFAKVTVTVSPRRMLGTLQGIDAQLWLKGRLINMVSKNGSYQSQIYNFTGLKPNLSYNVRFRVRNARYAGNWSEKTTIKTKEGRPGAPELFATDNVSKTSFTVRWIAPKVRNGIIRGYKVTVKNNKTRQVMTMTSKIPNVFKMDITGLQPYSKYIVRVFAFTDAGSGPPSGPRDVLTDVGHPPQPIITDLKLNLTANGVILVWEPKERVQKPEQTRYMVCWAVDIEANGECMHTQNSKPDQKAYVRVVMPRGPDKETTTFKTMIPASKLKDRGKRLMWYFYVYGRTKSLYCREDDDDTTRSSRIPRRRRRASAIKGELPCYDDGNKSERRKLVISLREWNLIRPDPGVPRIGGTSDTSIVILLCTLAFIILIVGSSVGCFVVCRRCGTHRGYDLALTNGLDRISSNGRGIASGDILEPLEPVLMPTIIPYSECEVPPIEAHLFPDHVTNLRANSEAGFCQEFDEIDKNQINSWPDSVARMPENAQKNRYTNIFPYDHTRVRLLNLQGRKSDYINANFIDGYNKKNAYIAAQGPMPATFDDFWQMIWEQRTNTIVMISNLIERGRLKCDQYWPTVPGHEGCQQYGRIHVTLNSQEELAYYIVREMTVRNVKSKKVRHVHQYQYTDWPDFAVPESPLPVLVFIRKTVRHIGKGTGPILVHCSAGVGRTGTYLCIESQIRQYEREKNFNVRGFLEHIRQQRMKLVQTEEQYAFIHDALLMHYLCPYHEIPRNELSAYVKLLKETEPCTCIRLEREFSLCISYRPHDWELICSMKPVNERKSRSDIYPTYNRQVALPAEPGVEGSNYINASYLQGYWRREEFIVTQHPIEHTITDFWKMVWDQNSSQVILLTANAPNIEYPCFWPSNPDDTKEAGYLRVGFLSRREHSHSTHLKFLVSSTREDYSLVSNMWVCKAWPNSAEGCMDLFQFIRHEREKTGPFIVIDELGGSRAGIFCALNTLMDQLDKENAVDVYFVFKMYHRQRPGIWQSQADLEFVYDAIERYSREPPPVHSGHPGSTSHHSSPGVAPPDGTGGGERHLNVTCMDSLPRGGRLTPNGCTVLAGADPTLSFYSNGGSTVPRLIITLPNNGSATLDSNASHDASDENELPT